MSQATQQPQTVTEYLRTNPAADPKTLLDLAIAETERTRANLDAATAEYQQLSDVTFDDYGLHAANMNGLWRLAKIFADSTMVPENFQGRRENCFLALQAAQRLKCDPFMFIQKCYVIHGRPGIEATLAISLANNSGLLKGRIKYERTGEDGAQACRAYAELADGSGTIDYTISVKDAKQAGWWDKKDSLWPKMTELFLTYRSAMWLIRTNMPEVILGLLSKEELQEIDLDDDLAPAIPQRDKRIGKSDLNERLVKNGEPKPSDKPFVQSRFNKWRKEIANADEGALEGYAAGLENDTTGLTAEEVATLEGCIKMRRDTIALDDSNAEAAAHAEEIERRDDARPPEEKPEEATAEPENPSVDWKGAFGLLSIATSVNQCTKISTGFLNENPTLSAFDLQNWAEAVEKRKGEIRATRHSVQQELPFS